jgi:translation initiation factor RLI1
MPAPMAFLDYTKCRPEACLDGLCKATQACRYKLLKQEKPFEAPMMDPYICRGCNQCVRACPLKAIQRSTF